MRPESFPLAVVTHAGSRRVWRDAAHIIRDLAIQEADPVRAGEPPLRAAGKIEHRAARAVRRGRYQQDRARPWQSGRLAGGPGAEPAADEGSAGRAGRSFSGLPVFPALPPSAAGRAAAAASGLRRLRRPMALVSSGVEDIRMPSAEAGTAVGTAGVSSVFASADGATESAAGASGRSMTVFSAGKTFSPAGGSAVLAAPRSFTGGSSFWKRAPAPRNPGPPSPCSKPRTSPRR